MRYAFQFKINCKGGILSPGYLHGLLKELEKAGTKHVRFGLRQQLLINAVRKDSKKIIAALKLSNADFEINKDVYPNISSSYAAAEVFTKESWLSQGVYKDIFDQFEYKPKLKINIADSNQSFTPFFTGNINWISSKQNHFWHLYIRFPKTNILYEWKELIYTNDIARLSNEIEKRIFKDRESFYDNTSANGNKLYETIASRASSLSKPADEKLVLPTFQLPYYEGQNNYGDKSWLGIYRRDELFTVSFLKDVCKLCLETSLSELYATPWKSLIIKGIEIKDQPLWHAVLNKHRITVRHASSELNWQVEDANEDGLMLKKQIIREFDHRDVRTYGLCFAIKTQPKSGVYGSVLVRRQFKSINGKLKPLAKFDILYTTDFNPNSKEFILFRNDVIKKHLPTYLVGLCKYFYEQKREGDLLPGSTYTEEKIRRQKTTDEKYIYQCKHCKTVYDEELGESEKNIIAGTLFDDLPLEYCCPLCEAPKSEFEQKELKLLGFQVI